MNLDANTILLSLVIGGIGLVCFMYGKRQQRVPHVVAGLALMVYPYFVSNLLLSAGIGAALCGALWLAVYLGL
jgi:hypothetical protein